MNSIDALILGIVQGITEFFPVSSSFHLKMTKLFLGLDNGFKSTLFDLSCHLGTLCLVIFFLRREILEVLLSLKKMALITIALIPLVPVYLLISPIRELAYNEHFMGFYLIILSFLLFFVANRESFYPQNKTTESYYKIRDMLFIGGMQSIALIPGFSRSGLTVSGATFRGWRIEEAIRFSFLLAIPTILGGSCLEVTKFAMHKSAEEILPISNYLIGFSSSLIAGILPCKLIFSIKNKKWFNIFAIYCFLIGTITAFNF